MKQVHRIKSNVILMRLFDIEVGCKASENIPEVYIASLVLN
jgi:hypothetical protein